MLPSQVIAEAIKSHGGDQSIEETWQRTAEHLEENGVKDYSIQLGPKLNLDPVTESFTGANPPNHWLTREYRAPYSLPDEATV
jgi:hypothetical protein